MTYTLHFKPSLFEMNTIKYDKYVQGCWPKKQSMYNGLNFLFLISEEMGNYFMSVEQHINISSGVSFFLLGRWSVWMACSFEEWSNSFCPRTAIKAMARVLNMKLFMWDHMKQAVHVEAMDVLSHEARPLFPIPSNLWFKYNCQTWLKYLSIISLILNLLVKLLNQYIEL